MRYEETKINLEEAPVDLQEAIANKTVENDIFTYKLSYVLKVVCHYTNGEKSDTQYKAYLSNGGIVVVLTQIEGIYGVLEYSMKSDDIRRIYETVI